MRHPDPRLIDRLAAEFVLGTLRGPARVRFARWIGERNDVAQAVRGWEDHLAGLARTGEPEVPPPHVWPQIARRLGVAQRDGDGPLAGASLSGAVRTMPRRSASRRFVALALAASVALALVAGWLYLRPTGGAVAWQAAAELRPAAAAATAWHIEFDATTHALRASAERPLPAPPGGAHELWALRDAASPPVSLGLLPQAGRRVVRLTASQLAALAAARDLAVSEEPRGGSPTGLPTGRVVLVAPRNALRFST